MRTLQRVLFIAVFLTSALYAQAPWFAAGGAAALSPGGPHVGGYGTFGLAIENFAVYATGEGFGNQSTSARLGAELTIHNQRLSSGRWMAVALFAEGGFIDEPVRHGYKFGGTFAPGLSMRFGLDKASHLSVQPFGRYQIAFGHWYPVGGLGLHWLP
jgi:hypothetical protein